MMIAQALEVLLRESSAELRSESLPNLSYQTFRLLIIELTKRYTCIKGFTIPDPTPIQQVLYSLRGINITLDYEEDLDMLFGVFNFHFRKSQMKGTTQMINDDWSAAVIQTPFRPALDWIEEYCTDLPLLNGEVLIELFRKTLSVSSNRRSSAFHYKTFL